MCKCNKIPGGISTDRIIINMFCVLLIIFRKHFLNCVLGEMGFDGKKTLYQMNRLNVSFHPLRGNYKRKVIVSVSAYCIDVLIVVFLCVTSVNVKKIKDLSSMLE